MGPKELISKLESDKEWKGWRKDDKDAYLAHIFQMVDETNERSMQVGYYNKERDQMVIFIERKKGFERSEEMSIVKKPEAKIEELEINRIAIGFAEADKIAKELRDEKYKGEAIERDILILQTLDSKPIFNNTYITSSFKVLNVKVNAETQEVESHMLKSIMELGKYQE